MSEDHQNARLERYFYRFGSVDSDFIGQLKDLIPKAQLDITPNKRKAGTFVVSVLLDATAVTDPEPIAALIERSSISESARGLYISLVTERDNDGIRVPEPILVFYFCCRGQIDFSFVSGV